MLYSMKTAEATTATLRVVDTHSLLHLRASKAAKACDAADAVDGLVVVQNPTLRLAAAAYGVSIGSVARARRLTPEQREAVRRGKRPLILPRAPATPPARPVPSVAPATPSVPPVVMVTTPRQKLDALVAEVGFDSVLTMLAAVEKVAA
jgi:hypothetical protein